MEEYHSPYKNFDPIALRDIRGVFRIAAYQRGYRWQRRQMEQLLSDVTNCAASGKYYLQPVVIKFVGTDDQERNIYELIDGQQRLTSIYLILKYCQNHGLPIPIPFDIDYDIRKDSAEFLKNIEIAEFTEYIDFVYLHHAYFAIDDWLKRVCPDPMQHTFTLMNLVNLLTNNVHIFWYEVDPSTDSYELFSNLNIGKIPLNNAELIKALFLCKDQTGTSRNGLSDEQQHNIAIAWEDIEHRLRDSSFWGFLANYDDAKYSSRIELLFDILAGKSTDESNPFFTFNHFNTLLEGKSREEILEQWIEIKKAFLTFCNWFSDSKYYHKIGYLVAINKENPLHTLYNISRNCAKSEFKAEIDKRIKVSVDFDYSTLGYKRYDDTVRFLLLHNVLYVYNLQDSNHRFPFNLYKDKNGGWSLEHIHAQSSETLNTKEMWREWIELHLKSLLRLAALPEYREDGKPKPEIADLIEDMQRVVDDTENYCTRDSFREISRRYAEVLPVDAGGAYVDRLSNMALLGKYENSVLNNSTFDVKRERIKELAASGKYIPLCTLRVFLKAYTDGAGLKVYYAWMPEDRKAYVSNIYDVLKEYLNDDATVLLKEEQ